MLFIKPVSKPETANDSGEASRWPEKTRWAGIQKWVAGQTLTLGERLNNLKKATELSHLKNSDNDVYVQGRRED